jgi:hypothetical protein
MPTTMNTVSWTRFAFAVLAGGIVSSMTDWLFMGDWLYRRYNAHPEIWRVHGGDETKAILWASALPFLTCGVFDAVCVGLHLRSYGATLKLALAVWLIGPLPLIIVNSLFIKIEAGIAAAHAVGWLVKLLVAALSLTLIVR